MTAIHLYMMKQEGDRERSMEEATALTPPHQHGIAKQIRVLVHDAIIFILSLLVSILGNSNRRVTLALSLRRIAVK